MAELQSILQSLMSLLTMEQDSTIQIPPEKALASATGIKETEDTDKNPPDKLEVSAMKNATDRVMESFQRENLISIVNVEVPSLSLEPTVKATNTDSFSVTHPGVGMNNHLLRQLLLKGNPFPPKTSYAKGKKKLQKRRRSSYNRQSAIAAAAAADAIISKETSGGAAADVVTAPSGVNHYKQKKKLNDLIEQMKRPIAILGNGSSDINKSEDISLNDIITEFQQVAKDFNHNVQSTFSTVLNEQIIHYLSVLVHKSIQRNNGEITYDIAKILSFSSHDENDVDHDHEMALFYDEEEDYKKYCPDDDDDDDYVDNNDGDKTNKLEKKSLSSTNLQEETNNDDKRERTEHIQENVTAAADAIDHVAKISSIHENSPSLREMFSRDIKKKRKQNQRKQYNLVHSNSRRNTKNVIKSCSTSFKILPLADNDEEEDGLFTVPIQFETVFSCEILKYETSIALNTLGTIHGKKKHDSISDIKIILDIDSLMKAMVENVVDTIKGAIRSSKVTHGTKSNKRIQISNVSKHSLEKQDEKTITPQNNMNDNATAMTMNSMQMVRATDQKNNLDNGSNLMAASNASESIYSRKRPRNEDGIINDHGKDARRPKIDENEVSTATFAPNIDNSCRSKGYDMNATNHSVGLNSNIAMMANNTFAEDVNGYRKRRSVNSAIEAIRMAERRHSQNQALILNAAERARFQEDDNAMNPLSQSATCDSRRNSMVSAAEAVRLAEMSNQLDSLGSGMSGGLNVLTNMTHLHQQENQPRRNSTSTVELMRLIEMNRRMSANSASGFITPESIRRTSNSFGTSTAADLASILDPYRDEGHRSSFRRRSSYVQEKSAMEDVLHAFRRRSSAGNSVSAVAEAVRIAEIDMAISSMRQGQTRSHPSITAAAEAHKMAELEANRHVLNRGARNSFGGTGTGAVNSIAAAAEIVRMQEENNMRMAYASNYGRTFDRQQFTGRDDMMRDTDGMNTFNNRSSFANNPLASTAEIVRLAEMESSNAYNNINNDTHQQQVDRQRAGVSFRLNNLNNYRNGMNGL